MPPLRKPPPEPIASARPLALRRLRAALGDGERTLDFLDAAGEPRPLVRLPRYWPRSDVEALPLIDAAFGSEPPAGEGDAGARVELEIELAGTVMTLRRYLGSDEGLVEAHEAPIERLGEPHLCRLYPTRPAEASRSLPAALLAPGAIGGLPEHALGDLDVEPADRAFVRLVRLHLIPERLREDRVPAHERELEPLRRAVSFLLGCGTAPRLRAARGLSQMQVTLDRLRRSLRQGASAIPAGPGAAVAGNGVPADRAVPGGWDAHEWPESVTALRRHWHETLDRQRQLVKARQMLSTNLRRKMQERDRLYECVRQLRGLRQAASAVGGQGLVCGSCLAERTTTPCGACGSTLPPVPAEHASREAERRRLSVERELAAMEKRASAHVQEARKAIAQARSASGALSEHLSRWDVSTFLLIDAAEREAVRDGLWPQDLRREGEVRIVRRHENAMARLRQRFSKLESASPAPDDARSELEQRIARLHGELGLGDQHRVGVDEDFLPRPGEDRDATGPADASRIGWVLWQISLFQMLHDSKLAAVGLMVVYPHPPQPLGGGRAESPLAAGTRAGDRLEGLLEDWSATAGSGAQIVLV